MRATGVETVSVKYFRGRAGDHQSYGADIDTRLDSLLKNERARNALRQRLRARIPGTEIVVERHEDGPTVFGIPVNDLVNYAGVLATLASLWLQLLDRRQKTPSHEVRLKIGSREYRGPIRGKAEFDRVVRFLRSR
jgi:hypothetical protein